MLKFRFDRRISLGLGVETLGYKVVLLNACVSPVLLVRRCITEAVRQMNTGGKY